MTTGQTSSAAASLLVAVAVAIAVIRWWRNRGEDVTASRRAATVAAATTVLVIPVLGLVGAGAPPALMCWVFLVPVAWGSVGVSNVAEQRQARARDLALGAPLRPVLWHPWLIGAIVAAGLFACMLGALLAVVAVNGDVGTSLVVAAAGSVVCGTFTLAWTQVVRRALAGGRGPATVLSDLDRLPRRKSIAAGALVMGAAAVIAGVACASNLELGTGTPADVAMVFASTPGWMLIALGWLAAHPHRPISAEDLGE